MEGIKSHPTMSLHGVENREVYPSLIAILSNFPESCLHHADAQHAGCEGHGGLAPALSAADSDTHATAVGSLPGGCFWHLSLVALPPVSPSPSSPLISSSLLICSFVRNKRGVLHSGLAVSVGGLEAVRYITA